MLSNEQIAFYRENGYILVPGLLRPDEAACYREEGHALFARLQKLREMESTWGAARQAAGEKQTSILGTHDLQFHSGAFARLIVDERVTGVAADIIGPNVQLHHTKMFIKPPEKGSPFPLHQDAPFFPHEKHTMIAAIIHFDDAPLEKGCVRVVPGSYKKGILEHIADGGWHLSPKEYPIESALPIQAKAGDALFFSYLTIHGSGINESSEPRTTLLIQMRAPDDRPTIQTHLSNGQGMMLRGIDPTCASHAAWEPPPTPQAGEETPAMGGAIGKGGAMGMGKM